MSAGFWCAWAARQRRFGRRHAPTFLFADLVGYTALTEERGDIEAAAMARDFGRKMRALSRRHDARQLKSMGDGVMIWVADPARAVALAAATIDPPHGGAGTLPVRVGVHTGPAVRYGCDWYGSAVNIAARLATEAGPGEALISSATRAAAGDRSTHPLRAPQELALRGINWPIVAWRLA
jgi:adenylate cyclase